VSAIAAPGLERRVDDIVAARSRSRLLRYAFWTAVHLTVLWSIYAIVVKDTDWSRILTGSLGETLLRVLKLDTSIIADLWEPILETVLMATLATLAGLLLSVPVA
jgi:ABC-type phosphate/phosphonate transport system permease subunit